MGQNASHAATGGNLIRVNFGASANECRGEPQVIVPVSRCNWCIYEGWETVLEAAVPRANWRSAFGTKRTSHRR